MAFQCTVVTPEQQAFSAQVIQAIIPAYDGLLGILTDRAPLLAKLGTGPLRLDLPGNQRKVFLVDGGVAQMRDNVLTILTTEATAAEEVDYNRAKEAYEKALARRVTDEKTAAAREHDLARARAMQAVAGQK